MRKQRVKTPVKAIKAIKEAYSVQWVAVEDRKLVIGVFGRGGKGKYVEGEIALEMDSEIVAELANAAEEIRAAREAEEQEDEENELL